MIWLRTCRGSSSRGSSSTTTHQVWKKAPLADQTNYEEKADTEKEENSTDEKEEPKNSRKIVEEEAESELFKVGDIVDILDTDEGAETAGGWSE